MNLAEKFREKPAVRPLVPGASETDYAIGHPRIEWEYAHDAATGHIGLRIGTRKNSRACFSPNGLRQFAEFLIALADQEDAAGK